MSGTVDISGMTQEADCRNIKGSPKIGLKQCTLDLSTGKPVSVSCHSQAGSSWHKWLLSLCQQTPFGEDKITVPLQNLREDDWREEGCDQRQVWTEAAVAAASSHHWPTPLLNMATTAAGSRQDHHHPWYQAHQRLFICWWQLVEIDLEKYFTNSFDILLILQALYLFKDFEVELYWFWCCKANVTLNSTCI